MIRPAITLRSKEAQWAINHLCAVLESRHHDHSWYIPRVVEEARADIETLCKLGVIMDVEQKETAK